MKRLLYIAIGTIIAFIAIIAGYVLILMDRSPRQFATVEGAWVAQVEKRLKYIYTDIFPRARACASKNGTLPTSFHTYEDQCNGEIRSIIDSKFDDLLDECTRSKKNGCTHGSRLPVYFIKLQDKNNIEKLFQDGTYFIEKVDTKGEKAVVKMLQGKRNPLRFPLYTCCGGNDVPASFPLLPSRIYLKDFYTEIDYIFPIKDDNDEIIGGYVRLYGD